MKSRASFKAHPLHPARIPFPFAFLMGSLAFDLFSVIGQRPSLWMTGGYLPVAGIAARAAGQLTTRFWLCRNIAIFSKLF